MNSTVHFYFWLSCLPIICAAADLFCAYRFPPPFSPNKHAAAIYAAAIMLLAAAAPALCMLLSCKTAIILLISPMTAAILLLIMAKSSFNTAVPRLLFLSFISIDTAIHGSASAQMMDAHFLASAHIIISAAAKLSIVSAALFSICLPQIPPQNSLRTALILQCLSLLTGMIWAFDAPDWGTPWQWDFIELSSLVVFILLFSAFKHRRNEQFFSILTIISLCCQTAAVYLFGLGNSRHSYTASASAITSSAVLSICMLAWIAAVVWIRQQNSSAHAAPSPLHRTAAYTAVGILALSAFHPLSPFLAAISLSAVWISLSLIPPFTAAFIGTFALMISCLFTAPRIEQLWVSTDADANSWSLEGIQAHPIAPQCTSYTADLRSPYGNDISLETAVCNSKYISGSSRIIINISGISSVQASIYRADRGLHIVQRSITLEILFIFLFALSLIPIFRSNIYRRQ